MPDGPRPDWDDRLRERLRAGDDRALEDLYDQYASHVYGLALRVTGDERTAEQVTVEVLSRAWADIHDDSSDDLSLRAYLSLRTHTVAARHRRDAS